jgi:L-ribulose-5-phosphate 4-epimerase
MMETEFSGLAREVLATAQQMAAEGLVSPSGSAGNISARFSGRDLAAITPSGLPYVDMEEDDIVMVNLNGEIVAGHRRPSSEAPYLTLILREMPEIGAIVHTHSPYATAFSALRQSIPLICNEGFVVNAAQIEVAPFRIPGSEALAKVALQTLRRQPGCRAVLLANHGILSIGETLSDAFQVAANVEWEAKVYWLAISVGSPHRISAKQFKKIKRHYASLRDS